jgi:hypothetical protein
MCGSTIDPTVISWDIEELDLADHGAAFAVVGTSDQCRVTFSCADEATAERLVATLNGSGIVGATAEVTR